MNTTWDVFFLVLFEDTNDSGLCTLSFKKRSAWESTNSNTQRPDKSSTTNPSFWTIYGDPKIILGFKFDWNAIPSHYAHITEFTQMNWATVSTVRMWQD